MYGPSPKKTTPFTFALGEDVKQIANFRGKLKEAENWAGREILVRPSPAIPWAPWARPFSKKLGPQTNKNLGTFTTRPELDPSVDSIWTTSDASSPLVAVLVKGFSGKRPHVLLLHPGLGGELHVPQVLEFAREHWAELQRAGR